MKTPFNVKDIKFDNIKFIPSGNGKSVMLRYLHNNKQNKFFIQTPELVLSNIESDDNITTLYFDLKSLNSNRISSFINFLINLDKTIIQNARANKDWFSSNNIKFKGLIRYNNSTEPYLKLKVKSSSIYKLRVTSDRQSEKCVFSDLKPNMKVKMIIDVNGLWINNNGFGIYLKPFIIDIRETYDLILNNSSEEDIVDTEIIDKTETNSVLNFDTDNLNVTEANSILNMDSENVNVSLQKNNDLLSKNVTMSLQKNNDLLSKNVQELLNELSESSDNNSEIQLSSLNNDSSNESLDNDSSNESLDESDDISGLQLNSLDNDSSNESSNNIKQASVNI